MLSGILMSLGPFTVSMLMGTFTLRAVAWGILFPCSINLLLAPHRGQAGTISALSGATQMGLSALLIGPLVAYWIHEPADLGVACIIGALIIITVALLLVCYARSPRQLASQA
ncbi:MFS transporter [Dongshaea marina]|uniref:hypothetical protein n=1 Tax=Dongshaea marina TaxID=2047966 RepID=UPI00131F2D49|nr:hypothetical protein [Dongshaea marina]